MTLCRRGRGVVESAPSGATVIREFIGREWLQTVNNATRCCGLQLESLGEGCRKGAWQHGEVTHRATRLPYDDQEGSGRHSGVEKVLSCFGSRIETLISQTSKGIGMNDFLIGVDDNHDFVVDRGKFTWTAHLNRSIEPAVPLTRDV